MTQKIKTDLCVIGAGSGGLSVAAGAAMLGRKVVLIEGHKMGGDCLNFGCVPSKALLAAGKTAQTFRDAKKYGIAPVSDPMIDYSAVHDHVQSVIAAIEPNDSQERFEGLGCTVIREFAKFTGPREVTAGDYVISAKHFVISTGSSPFVPPMEGLDSVPYITNETIFDRTERPSHLLIIGGGPIGVEMAQAHRRLGAEVTLLERGPMIMPKDDPELVGIVIEHLTKEGIRIETNAMVERAENSADGGVTLHGTKDGQPFSVTGSHLLVAAGRKANFENLGLEAAGVETHQRGIKVNDLMQTSNKRIYAIGDVTGGRQFTHVAGYHAGLVIQNILFKTPNLTFGLKGGKNRDHIAPWVTYTDPELAHVGLNEPLAKEQNVSYTLIEWEYAENDRAQAEHATSGKLKALIGKKGKILGCSIVGKNAGDLIGPWALAVANGLKISAFTGSIMPYPTLSEISKRAAGAYYTPTLFSKKTQRIVGLLSSFD
ncbi:NAD(P)/FAD-dependent oxidoreductase [Parvularcula marina]|uniref:dihydrolipoyl dehydrogenase family protein n=1 Tax=Parvularcula marina TaxID=2292771 RepID=UPI0035135642